jgi:hypothetical protein
MSGIDLVFKISNTSSKETGTLKVVAFAVQHSTRHYETLTHTSADERTLTVVIKSPLHSRVVFWQTEVILYMVLQFIKNYGFNGYDTPASNESRIVVNSNELEWMRQEASMALYKNH